jgi:tRNA nucleotidyltransferase (CCA-adding enzyme)
MAYVRIYKVGGAVRDAFLGVENKDIDFAVEAPSYDDMRDYILEHGRIYLEQPEYFTIRAHIDRGLIGAPYDADFVLCRREGTYKDGRRPDRVFVGTIYDDLARRDLTMNAIAVDMETGEILDPFHGVKDLNSGILRPVGKPEDRFEEDALRMLRALRFAITKNMKMDKSIVRLLKDPHYLDLLENNISMDRKKDELERMFKYDTSATLVLLAYFPELTWRLFGEGSAIWLKPTNEKR